MAKIILAMNGEVLREIALSKERITIGRSPHNDVVIDNLAISAEHAAVVTVNNDSFLEDLNSTNGTQVNGQPIKKHFLQENDVIELAQYRLRYLAGDDSSLGLDNRCDAQATNTAEKRASIKVLNGANAGKETLLTKTLTTIGRPDLQVAVITQRPDGYYIAHVEGERPALVNQDALGGSAQALSHGDVIAIAGIQLQFRLI